MGNAIFDILVVRNEICDLILIFGYTDESVLAKDNNSSIVFWWIFVLFKHQM